jgi:hypothetical protein
MAWHRLRPEQTKRATIKVIGGPVYSLTMFAAMRRASSRGSVSRSPLLI